MSDDEVLYNLMQAYRHAPVTDQATVCEAFEAVKAHIHAQLAAMLAHSPEQEIEVQQALDRLNESLAYERDWAPQTYRDVKLLKEAYLNAHIRQSKPEPDYKHLASQAEAKLTALASALEYMMKVREIKCLAPKPLYNDDCGDECAYHRARRLLDGGK